MNIISNLSKLNFKRLYLNKNFGKVLIDIIKNFLDFKSC